MNAAKVVIEYEFQGYTPPTDTEAFFVAATIVHAAIPATGGNLQTVRQNLEEHNLTLHGAHQLKTHNRGRYNPRWREVWEMLQ